MNVVKRSVFVLGLPVTVAAGGLTIVVGALGACVGGVGLGLYTGGKYIATGKVPSKELAEKYWLFVLRASDMPTLAWKKGLGLSSS